MLNNKRDTCIQLFTLVCCFLTGSFTDGMDVEFGSSVGGTVCLVATMRQDGGGKWDRG